MKYQFSAICKSLEDARQLAKMSGVRIDNPYGFSQEWIDTIENPRGGLVHWWKDESPPVIPDSWTAWYWQGGRSSQKFYSDLQTAELARKQEYQANFERFREKYPNLEWQITDEPYFFMVWCITRYGGGSSGTPIPLTDARYATADTLLAAKSQVKQWKQDLMAEYPFLWFDPGANSQLPMVTPAMQNVIGGGDPTRWAVYTRYYCDYTKEWRCGTTFRFSFTLPLTAATVKALTTFNAQAEQANQDGWFLCSVCQRAYPRSDYGYYYFAETRCKTCLEADPKWEKQARAETYD